MPCGCNQNIARLNGLAENLPVSKIVVGCSIAPVWQRLNPRALNYNEIWYSSELVENVLYAYQYWVYKEMIPAYDRSYENPQNISFIENYIAQFLNYPVDKVAAIMLQLWESYSANEVSKACMFPATQGDGRTRGLIFGLAGIGLGVLLYMRSK